MKSRHFESRWIKPTTSASFWKVWLRPVKDLVHNWYDEISLFLNDWFQEICRTTGLSIVYCMITIQQVINFAKASTKQLSHFPICLVCMHFYFVILSFSWLSFVIIQFNFKQDSPESLRLKHSFHPKSITQTLCLLCLTVSKKNKLGQEKCFSSLQSRNKIIGTPSAIQYKYSHTYYWNWIKGMELFNRKRRLLLWPNSWLF